MTLNEDVALSLKWTRCKNDVWFNPDVIHDCDSHGKLLEDWNGLEIQPPDYEHDIAAAWDLVPLISRFTLINDHGDKGWSVEYEIEDSMDIAEGDTAPEAICKAFLATRGGDNEVRNRTA